MDDIYTQNIIEHAKNPHHFGKLSNATVVQDADNPSCGDSLKLFLLIDDTNRVSDASFTGSGCAISTAASSMLMDTIIGKTLDELKIISPGDIYSMLRIDISPGRSKCALLSYQALEEILKK